MSSFTIDIDVRAAPDDVFGFISDATRTPEWYEAVQDAKKITTGPVGEGTRFRFTRRLPQGEVANDVEVSEFDEPNLICFSSRTGPTPFTYRYRVEPTESGSRVELQGDITGEGLRGPAALLAPMAGTFFKRGMARNLETLKCRLER